MASVAEGRSSGAALAAYTDRTHPKRLASRFAKRAPRLRLCRLADVRLRLRSFAQATRHSTPRNSRGMARSWTAVDSDNK